MANKAIKYRIYPTTEQSIMFAKTFGCCRKVYNLMLADKIEGYKVTSKFPIVTPAKYKKDYPYLKEVHTDGRVIKTDYILADKERDITDNIPVKKQDDRTQLYCIDIEGNLLEDGFTEDGK